MVRDRGLSESLLRSDSSEGDATRSSLGVELDSLVRSDSTDSSEQAAEDWRSEFRCMMGIAGPTAVTLFANVGMSLTNVAVLGHYSTEALSAASFASLWMNVTMELICKIKKQHTLRNS